MAYQDSQVPLHQYPPPPSQSQQDSRYSQSSMSSSSGTQPMPDLEPVRSRSQLRAQQDGYTSDSNRYNNARKPINEAVASAFNTSDATAAAIPPELLAHLTTQITANVLQQLKSTNLSTPTTAASGQNILPDNLSSTTGSPPMGRTTVYTPPSPYRASEEATQTQPSPSGEAKTSQQTYGRGTPPIDKRPLSPLSSSSHAEDSDAREDRAARPRGPKRISTGDDATILEKVWGTLFNEQGQATVRLGQFLRGIAVHLIEDYEPKHSIVITPTKLQKYYQETKVASEIYPWQVIFDDRTSSISRMFREIEAEHHLVQEKLSERPDLPGLTPRGFETWATLLLRAHPDQEFERLAKTALDMPISNPDDKKERFPKELSRRLFPKDSDTTSATKLQKAMSAHCNVSFASRNNSNATTDTHPRVEPTTQSSVPKPSTQPQTEKQEPNITPVTSHDNGQSSYPGMERRWQPYSNQHSNPPSEAAIEEEDDDTPTPQPIERERKPYVAQPGGGKNYDSNEHSSTADYKAPAPEVNLGRTSSISGGSRQARPAPIAIHQTASQSTPVDIPETRHQRTNSTYYKDQASRSGRNRSPSMSKDNGYGRRSDADTSHGSYHSSSSHEIRDDNRRYRDYEAQREARSGDKYDAARMAAYDPRDRERERDPRPRGYSVAGGVDGVKIPYSASAEDEYYRGSAGYPPPPPREGYQSYPGSAQYPPNPYRETR